MIKYSVPTDSGSPVELRYAICEPEGRALRLDCFDDYRPKKEFKVEDLIFQPVDFEHLIVSSEGDVSFGDAQRCVRAGRVYGNVSSGPLLTIMRRIYHDEVYQARKLGGTRFIYHLAQEINPSFKVSGRINCDVCHAADSDVGLVEGIRQRLKVKGVVNEYKKYLAQRGLPKIN